MENRKTDFWITIVKKSGMDHFPDHHCNGINLFQFNENFLNLSNLNAIVLNSCILIILAAARGS